jgi:hypothetical protein
MALLPVCRDALEDLKRAVAARDAEGHGDTLSQVLGGWALGVGS